MMMTMLCLSVPGLFDAVNQVAFSSVCSDIDIVEKGVRFVQGMSDQDVIKILDRYVQDLKLHASSEL